MSLRTPSESWEAWTRPVKKILAFFGGMVGLGMVLLLVFSSPPPEDRMSRKGGQAPAAPLVPTPKPRVYVAAVVDQVCRVLLREQVATECYVDMEYASVTHRMVIYGLFGDAEARTICPMLVRQVSDLATRAQAQPAGRWQVRIHTPYTGAHPVATCWMYR